MFETASFRHQLRNVIEEESLKEGISHFEHDIAGYLQALAELNEVPLMEAESVKEREHKRGLPEALESARLLARQASGRVRDDGRDLLTLEDIKRFYALNYGKVWPFSKP